MALRLTSYINKTQVPILSNEKFPSPVCSCRCILMDIMYHISYYYIYYRYIIFFFPTCLFMQMYINGFQMMALLANRTGATVHSMWMCCKCNQLIQHIQKSNAHTKNDIYFDLIVMNVLIAMTLPC